MVLRGCDHHAATQREQPALEPMSGRKLILDREMVMISSATAVETEFFACLTKVAQRYQFLLMLVLVS